MDSTRHPLPVTCYFLFHLSLITYLPVTRYSSHSFKPLNRGPETVNLFSRLPSPIGLSAVPNQLAVSKAGAQI